MSGGGYKLNVGRVPLKKAREYADYIFNKKGVKGMGGPGSGIGVDDVYDDFDRNYLRLQAKVKRAKNIPRVQMPVLYENDIQEFKARLSEGYIDFFPPYAKGAWQGVPPVYSGMAPDEGAEWVTLGVKDGDPNDDKVMARLGKVPAKAMLPTQNQIWLEKLIGGTAKFGVPGPGSPLTKQTVILSAEGYLLDGHHRWGQLCLADPSIGISALQVGLDIDDLLEVGRAYTSALGRSPKQGSEEQLRNDLIRLAHTHPEWRSKILPLVVE